MVFNRLNILKIFFIFILSILFFILLRTNTNNIETNLAKSILPRNIIENTKIISVMEKDANAIKIIFESEDEDNNIILKQKFLSSINKKAFSTTNINFSQLINWYKDTPSNFVSPKTKQLLLNQEYEKIYYEGLERLYSPTSIALVEINKDPFLLLTDFLISNNIQTNHYINDKYYDTCVISLNKNIETNQEIHKLIKLQKTYSNNGNKIYLAGTPIHTYYTSLYSSVSINIICILVTLIIIFLTYLYFRNLKILLLIALSIAFGFLTSFALSRLIFSNFHIITFLFGTTLIGIGIDYSYHYVFSKKQNNLFFKDITLSLLSTVLAFSTLYLINIDILNQIATFINIGLIAIYIFILIIYPCIKFPKPVMLYAPNFHYRFKKATFIVISLLTVIGLSQIHYNDNLTSLYKPSKKLLNAETLFNNITNQTNTKRTIIVIKSISKQNLLENEEEITQELDKNNIDYICISKFIPSIKKQKENYNLVHKLYEHQLYQYNNILTKKQIQNLLEEPMAVKSSNNIVTSIFNNLLLENYTSMIIVNSNNIQINKNPNIEIIDIQTSISNNLNIYRNNMLKIFPIIFITIWSILALVYGSKSAAKMILPILFSSIGVISIISILKVEINMFNILGILLALGFTIDYAIFSRNTTQETKTAIFLSCITTTLSFFLLIFTTFKLISTLALTISLGIFLNYILIRIFNERT